MTTARTGTDGSLDFYWQTTEILERVNPSTRDDIGAGRTPCADDLLAYGIHVRSERPWAFAARGPPSAYSQGVNFLIANPRVFSFIAVQGSLPCALPDIVQLSVRKYTERSAVLLASWFTTVLSYVLRYHPKHLLERRTDFLNPVGKKRSSENLGTKFFVYLVTVHLSRKRRYALWILIILRFWSNTNRWSSDRKQNRKAVEGVLTLSPGGHSAGECNFTRELCLCYDVWWRLFRVVCVCTFVFTYWPVVPNVRSWVGSKHCEPFATTGNYNHETPLR